MSQVPKYLRRRAVCERYGLSASTIYAWVARGEFPRPVRFGTRAVAWAVADLEVWEQSKVGQRA